MEKIVNVFGKKNVRPFLLLWEKGDYRRGKMKEVKTFGGALLRANRGLAEGLALGVRSWWISDIFLEIKIQQGLVMDELWRVRERRTETGWMVEPNLMLLCIFHDIASCISIHLWKVKVAQSCLTLCDPMDYTVHGILQARILEWVVFPFTKGSSHPRDRTQVSLTSSHKVSPRILEWVASPFSRGSSWTRNQTRVSCNAGRFFTNWAIREVNASLNTIN